MVCRDTELKALKHYPMRTTGKIKTPRGGKYYSFFKGHKNTVIANCWRFITNCNKI